MLFDAIRAFNTPPGVIVVQRVGLGFEDRGVAGVASDRPSTPVSRAYLV